MFITPDTTGLPGFSAQLGRAPCIRLVSYGSDGTPFATPMWFVERDGAVLVWTAAASGKVARVRATPHVRISTCTRQGVPTSREVDAYAVVRSLEAADPRLLTSKYGWQKRALDCYWLLRRIVSRQPKATLACFAITPQLTDEHARGLAAFPSQR